MLQTVRKEKADEKNGLLSTFSYCAKIIKLSKKVHFFFFNFMQTSARTNSVKAIYIYTSENSYYTLENDMVWGLSHCL